MRAASYWGGRWLGALVVTFLGVVGLLYCFWFVSFDGFWSAEGHPRLVALAELVPSLGGVLGLAFVAPRMSWVEVQSSRRVDRRAAALAMGVVVAFASTPVVARCLWELGPAYTRFVPSGWELASFELRGQAAPWALFMTFASTVCLILCMVVLTMAAFGNRLGALSCVGWLVLLLFIQSWSGLAAFDANRAVPGLRRGETLVLGVLWLAAGAAYMVSEAGAKPILLGRHRAGV